MRKQLNKSLTGVSARCFSDGELDRRDEVIVASTLPQRWQNLDFACREVEKW